MNLYLNVSLSVFMAMAACNNSANGNAASGDSVAAAHAAASGSPVSGSDTILSAHPVLGKDTAIEVVNENGSLKYAGDILFNSDETLLLSISPGGYVKFRGNKLELTATPDAKGGVVYDLSVDHQKADPATGGKEDIAKAVKIMISMGAGAKGRVHRMYAGGGVPAVIKGIDSLRQDAAKRVYFEALLTGYTLSDNDLTAVTTAIGSSITNASEKSELLIRVESVFLHHPASFDKYCSVIKGIKDNSEKASVLQDILRQPLTEAQRRQLLLAANTITADPEKADFFEKLIMLHDSIPAGQWVDILQSISTVSAGDEKGRLLVQCAKVMPRTDRTKAAYIKAAKTIAPGSDQDDAIKALE